MGRYFKKTSLLFATSIFIQVIYHLALHVRGGGLPISAFTYIGRMGWISVDMVLCLAGFFCFRFISPSASGIRHWLSRILAFLQRVVPSYYLFLFLYLTLGVHLQNDVGNSFMLREGYIRSFLLFYANFLFARGPLSGVALESMFLVCMVFQLFFGIGIVLALAKSKKIAPAIIAPLWILGIALRFVSQGENLWFTFFNTFTRMDSFLAGLFLAYLYSFKGAQKILRDNKGRFLLVGAVVLLLSAALTQGLSRWQEKIDIISNPPIAVFAFALVNWVFSSRMTKLWLKIPVNNKMTFAVYMAKHPIIFFADALCFSKIRLPHTLLNNALFVCFSISLCYIFGLVWHYAVDRNVAYLLRLKRPARSLIIRWRSFLP